MKSIKRRIIIAVVLIFCIMAAVFAANLYVNQNAYVSQYTYASDKIPAEFDGFKIAVISDVHNSVYYDKIIRRLDEQDPDVIIFSGDMIQLPDSDLENVTKIADSQMGKCDMYAVFGNHEADNGAWGRRKIASELTKSGICVMTDLARDIEIGDAKIRLIGIADTGSGIVSDAEISRMRAVAEKNIADGELNILIVHRANLYPKIKDLDADLIISGHLHGGIIRLPFVGGLIGNDDEKRFPKYTSGVYKEGNAEMIVSRGCDYNLDKMRVFNPPDIPVITLRTAE